MAASTEPSEPLHAFLRSQTETVFQISHLNDPRAQFRRDETGSQCMPLIYSENPLHACNGLGDVVVMVLDHCQKPVRTTYTAKGGRRCSSFSSVNAARNTAYELTALASAVSVPRVSAILLFLSVPPANPSGEIRHRHRRRSLEPRRAVLAACDEALG